MTIAASPSGVDRERVRSLFGNALAMAAARAVMTEILTPDAYVGTQRLGARLAGGMRASVDAHGLPWHIHHLGPRSGYTFRSTPIRTGAEGRAAADDLLTRLIRIWLANRGVWEAIVGAGPVCSVPATDDDVDAYLDGWASLLDALTA
jgi:glutamate-1-semialdehyde aminotransferase